MIFKSHNDSSSESDDERHDRFKSERNVPAKRSKSPLRRRSRSRSRSRNRSRRKSSDRSHHKSRDSKRHSGQSSSSKHRSRSKSTEKLVHKSSKNRKSREKEPSSKSHRPRKKSPSKNHDEPFSLSKSPINEIRKSKSKSKSPVNSKKDHGSKNSNSFGPVLPPKTSNEKVKKRSSEEKQLKEESKKEKIKETKQEDCAKRKIGPEIPADLPSREEAYGPPLPPGPQASQDDSQEPDDEEDIGPLPEGAAVTPAQLALDHRARFLKAHMDSKVSVEIDFDQLILHLARAIQIKEALDLETLKSGLESLARQGAILLPISPRLLLPSLTKGEGKEVKKREEWMLELPEKQAGNLGLQARAFRKRDADLGDQTVWTDTPADKAKKKLAAAAGEGEAVSTEEEGRRALLKARDKEMEALAKKAAKRKDKSLLEIHRKKLKKKQKKEEKEKGAKKAERRPFSREIDLQTNKLDEAQKKSVIKKAQLLDSRFSSGESKYL